MSWEKFDKRKTNANDMTVSVQKTNKMSVSEAVVRELAAGSVELFYDRETNRMAFFRYGKIPSSV